MNDKFAWGVVILSLVYVPIQFCGGTSCTGGGHAFLLNIPLYAEVSISRLIIQVIVAIILALAIKKFDKG